MSGGSKFDGDKIRLELLSSTWLEGVGKVLTFGAKKYTKVQGCDCVESVKGLLTLEDCVGITTINILNEQIQNIESASPSMRGIGLRNIASIFRNIMLGELETKLQSVTASQGRKSIEFWIKAVNSALRQSESVSTTTTQAAGLEAASVLRAMLGLDGLKNQNGSTEHLNTCASLKPISGAHNWRKGIEITRLIGAALRHLFAFLRGEDNDPESGLSHIAHCSCCLMFISEIHRTKPELDDRVKE